MKYIYILLSLGFFYCKLILSPFYPKYKHIDIFFLGFYAPNTCIGDTGTKMTPI